MKKYNIDGSGIFLNGERIGTIFLTYRDDVIEINKIAIEEKYRGLGHAANIIQMLIDDADREGKTLALTPSGDFGASISRLTKFYRRLGFVSNKGRVKNFSTRQSMIREPKKRTNLEEIIYNLSEVHKQNKYNMKKISKKLARRVGKELGVDWQEISFDEFYKGMNVELEHGSAPGDDTNVTGDDPEITSKIVLAHLKEDEKYYSKLSRLALEEIISEYTDKFLREVMTGKEFSLRSHMTRKELGHIRDIPVSEQEIEYKPKGFWYDCDGEWKDWVGSNMPRWIGDFEYDVEIDHSHMLVISNLEQMKEFNDRYGIYPEESEDFYEDGLIDWRRVAGDYWGIEICPYIIRGKSYFRWYQSWDVASGCVWDSHAVKLVKKK